MLTTEKSPFGNAGEANEEIIRFMRERPKTQAFFLQTQYMDLHAPNLPPKKFLDRLGKSLSQKEQYRYGRQRSMRPVPAFTAGELEDLKLLYEACLAHVDSRIQEVCTELKRQGIYDDTMIIVTADHGEAFFEHSDLGHHAFLYEENIRVPLLIKYPHGAGSGTTREEMTRHIDIAPTIMDVAGVERPATYTGESLLAEGVAPDHAIAFTADRFAFEDVSHLDFTKFKIAIRTKEWKLIVYGTGPDELYHLIEDPDEKQNLLLGEASTEIKRTHAELRRTLEPYLNRIRAETLTVGK
jgi:uncharacterized sulfatase